MHYAGSTTESTVVYMVGGNKPPYNQAVKYDITTKEWMDLDYMITKRQLYPCAFVLDGKLCVVGGELDGFKLYSMECLDIENQTAIWQPSHEIRYGVSETSCIKVGSSVILTGGKHNYHYNMPISFVFQWTTNGGWKSLAHMRVPRSGHCTVTDGTKYVYVVSGYYTVTVERYDIVKDVWMYMAAFHKIIYYHACVYMNDTIVVTGAYRNVIYLYSVSADTWSVSSISLQRSINGHAMGVLP